VGETEGVMSDATVALTIALVLAGLSLLGLYLDGRK
jgi:hypothetical protein